MLLHQFVKDKFFVSIFIMALAGITLMYVFNNNEFIKWFMFSVVAYSLAIIMKWVIELFNTMRF